MIQDIRFALRTFLKNPGFSFIAILTLALGIGANTAIFTILDSVLLRTLPVENPQRLVALTDPDAHGMSSGSEGGDRTQLAYSEFEYLRDHNDVFSGIFAADSSLPQRQVSIANAFDAANPAAPAAHDSARVRLVSGDYFQTLGVQPVVGRAFGPKVDRARNSSPVAVISHGFWSRRFNLDPQVLGRKIEINKTSFEIVGVAPAKFFGESVGDSPDVWVPATMQASIYPGDDLLTAFPDGNIDQRTWLQVIARLKPGITLVQANASINVVFKRYVSSAAARAKLSPDETKGYSEQQIKLQSGARGSSTLHGTYAQPLKLLMALVALVLLIACANLANLLLARGAARQKEFAVRISIGAARSRLIRQLLTESFLLALIGAAAGLVLAQWADALLLRMVSGDGTKAIQLSLSPDARVLAFTFGIAALTAILFGLIPALRATRIDLSPALKSGASGFSLDALHRRFPVAKILVVAQIAVSLVLLVAAGLFVHSLERLSEVKLGYNSSRLILFRVNPIAAGYKDASVPQLSQQLLDKFRAVPGVSGVTISVDGLFTTTESGDPISVEGYTPKPGEEMDSRMDHVGPDYFSVVGMPILYGRGIQAQDSAPAGGNAPRVVVINQTFAKHFFPNTNPIGKRVRDAYPGSTADAEVVGVVADAKYRSLREKTVPRLYAPFFNPLWPTTSAYFEVRSAGDAASISSALRAVVHDTNPAIPEVQFHTAAGLVTESLHTDYFVALGSSQSAILRQVLRETLDLTLIGIAVGVPIALVGTRLIRTMLFGLSAADPVALIAACAILATIAIAASYIPARRASRVDPMVALGYE